MTRVMVVVASRHGATRGIADKIGETLRANGLEASVFDANEAPSPQSADAMVVGGGTYMGKWLDDVADYVRRHHHALAHRPTWLFASGPIGNSAADNKGRDPAPPPFLAGAARDLGARGVRVFFGRWNPADPPMSIGEHLFRVLPASMELMPAGDFRDWPAIEAWACEIARELAGEAMTAQAVGQAAAAG